MLRKCMQAVNVVVEFGERLNGMEKAELYIETPEICWAVSERGRHDAWRP